MFKKLFTILILVSMLCFVGTAYAETHTEFVTGNKVYTPVNDSMVYIISNTLDFADLTTTSAAAGVTGGDVVQMLDIPAGVIVKSVGTRIYSAWSTAGATCYGVTIGDGSDANGWLIAVDFGPTASGVSTSSGSTTFLIAETSAGVSEVVRPAYYSPGGKYYSSADTIDATIPIIRRTAAFAGAVSGCSDLQIQVWAECIKPSTQNAYGTVE